MQHAMKGAVCRQEELRLRLAHKRACFKASCKGRFNIFRCTMINADTFSPESGLILPQIVEISLPDVEISTPRPHFRNCTNSIMKLYLIYTHPILPTSDEHQISSISYHNQGLFAQGSEKGMGQEKKLFV